MFYLLLGFVSSALVSIIMRLSEEKVKNNIGMLVMNYLMCTLLALGETKLWQMGPSLHITAALGVVNGMFYLVSFVLLQRSVQKNGVVLSATFMKLGLLVSILVSVLFFREIPSWTQGIGFAIALAAIVLINYRKEAGAGKFNMGLLWLLLCGGMADAMSKIYEEIGWAELSPNFLFFTFATALPFCFLLMTLKGQRVGKWECIYGLLIGIPNFYSSKFLLRALETVPAVVAYPVYSVAAILIVTMTSVIVFRERLKNHQWLALTLILAALVLLNV